MTVKKNNLTRGAGWSSSSESDMLERSVAAPQSSRPSQIATEWAGTGQAAGDKTAEATKSCSATCFDQKYSNNQWKMTHVTGHPVLSWKLLNSSFLFIYYMFHVFYYVLCILCLTLCVFYVSRGYNKNLFDWPETSCKTEQNQSFSWLSQTLNQ